MSLFHPTLDIWVPLVGGGTVSAGSALFAESPVQIEPRGYTDFLEATRKLSFAERQTGLNAMACLLLIQLAATLSTESMAGDAMSTIRGGLR